jgi:hypothetical protein
MKTMILAVVLVLFSACSADDDPLDNQDAAVGGETYLVNTTGMSGPCLTDDRFLPPELVTIQPQADSTARLTLDFGEVVSVSWKPGKFGTIIMGASPYTGSQWGLLGGSFKGTTGTVSWDGPTGRCSQSVELTMVRL